MRRGGQGAASAGGRAAAAGSVRSRRQRCSAGNTLLRRCRCRTSVSAQANYEKSVYAKTSRTNARGEGAWTCTAAEPPPSFAPLTPPLHLLQCCGADAEVAGLAHATSLPLLRCCRHAAAARSLCIPLLRPALRGHCMLPPRYPHAQLRSSCLTMWWWCTSSWGTSCST